MTRSRAFASVLPLESRCLFAGGIDPSFRSSAGAFFDAPGKVPTLTDTDVDSLGRVVLVGYTQPATKPGGRQMFISRLDADGRPDSNFGVGGTNLGTPRGVVQLTDVAAAPDGNGYYALGQLGTPGTTSWRLLKFDGRGFVDNSFGKKGVVAIDLAADELVVQPDGQVVVIGSGVERGAEFDPAHIHDAYYAVRFSAEGRLDRSYGGGTGAREPDGYAFLSAAGDSDDLKVRTVTVNSASIDPGGRLLVGFDEEITFFGDFADQDFTYLKRLSGNGRADPKFAGGNLNAIDESNIGIRQRRGVAVGRPDGNIAVLLLQSNDLPEVMLAGARGQLSTRNSPGVAIDSLVPGFQHSFLTHDSIVATTDNKVIVAGSIVNGDSRTPALVRLNANLSLDTTFGDAGKLVLPTTGGVAEAAGLALSADSTITAFARPNPLVKLRAGDVPVVRIFQDDRPVASLRGSSRKGGQLRVTISVRGVDPILTNGLGAADFRVRAVDPGGSAVPNLLSFADAGNGDALMVIGVNRPRGTYDVVTLNKGVSDDDGDFVPAGTFATVTI